MPDLDMSGLAERVESGERWKVTYNYPAQTAEPELTYRTRTDALLAVEPSNRRVFVRFKDMVPVWIEEHEIVKVEMAP